MTTTFIFANNATSTLAVPCSDVDTTVTVSPGSGALFPAPTSGQSFAFCLVDAATGTRHEIMYCTSRAGDVLTVTRGEEGTTPQNWGVGDFGSNFITAGNAASFAQNISGAVVYLGTWNAATNTPPLTSGTGVSGTYYIVSVSGTTDLDGENIWAIGDWATFNGTTWERILGSANEIFNGLTVNTLNGVMIAHGSSPVTASAQLGVANGGTGLANPTVDNILVGNGTSALQEIPPGATNTVLYWDGTTWTTGVPPTLVGSFSAGTTGFTPNTATTGAVTLAGTLNPSNGGTGDSGTLTGLIKANGGSAMTSATGAEVVAVIGTTPVDNAVAAESIANTGGWNVTPTGTKIYFNYNGTDLASLDSSGNLIVLGDITSQSAP